MKHRFPDNAGVTLIEVLIAVSLLSLLSVGILMAMRVALGALGKANTKLMDNRRVAGAQRVLKQELEGLMPAFALCPAGPAGPPARIVFFQGEPESMRFVSTYSLQGAWRGLPQILEFTVIPGDQGRGVRLVVNEILYTGPLGAGQLCLGLAPGPGGLTVARYRPIEVGPGSFVLADKLAFCRFSYLEPGRPPEPDHWQPAFVQMLWPKAVRIEMAPLDQDPSRLRPLTVTAQIHLIRPLWIDYADQ